MDGRSLAHCALIENDLNDTLLIHYNPQQTGPGYFAYHPGPVMIYMSRPANGDVKSYRGDGDWFKVAYWGPKDNQTWSVVGNWMNTVLWPFILPHILPPFDPNNSYQLHNAAPEICTLTCVFSSPLLSLKRRRRANIWFESSNYFRKILLNYLSTVRKSMFSGLAEASRSPLAQPNSQGRIRCQTRVS